MEFSGYVINEFQFHTQAYAIDKATQYSGVSQVSHTRQIASAKDKNPIYGDESFYGVIDEIWKLDYHMFNLPAFKCYWFDSNSGVKVDDMGFTLINTNRLGHKYDPFILASQFKQVFYTTDQLDENWVVVSMMPKGMYKSDLNNETDDHMQFESPVDAQASLFIDGGDNDDFLYTRPDAKGIWVE
ncbi:hypothetical protein Pint_07848 [Pistacia integerrima]|uniref:Uncharacterized protein n=1 Tax=Pistacia integerrima TaxID=434235 RepID=A0ACC0XTK2_9ROSI|nr:hypothetical protein Pint_07848 [Pistacia integerrima]